MRNLTLLLVLILASPAFARHVPTLCGTRPGMWKEEHFLHRQSVRARALRRSTLKTAEPAGAAVRTIGNIAVLEDADGVVSRRNSFNLNQRSITFLPTGSSASGYSFQTGTAAYDAAAATAGTRVTLDDDDSRLVSLPFAFPFYGSTYREVWLNSDGNLTFTAGDNASSDRSLGRVTAGPPRIAPLFDDLDPTGATEGVRVLSEAGRVVVSWPEVPEWTETGYGSRQTFQVRLHQDGRIEFAYGSASPAEAVVGIAPGSLRGSSTLVSFVFDPSAEYTGAIAERFSGTLAIDTATAAQKFYATQEDAYDFLVFFNNLDIESATGAVAWESTVRNSGTGFGDYAVDVGTEYGSRARLQSIMNMGPLSQYPTNPTGLVSRRGTVGDTPVTVIAHEAGHRFLAYASVPDPDDSTRLPMLGYQSAHWTFGFNSEASLLEGNRIRDNGDTISPRFETTGTVEGYSPLDQYLMGFRAPDEVEAHHQMFYVSDSDRPISSRLPQKGFTFNGTRHNVRMAELIDTMGRRTPDHTVAQRRFRFAFVLVVAKGSEPSADDLTKIEGFRTAFEDFFRRASSDRAVADTSLKLELRLSLAPAAGVLVGRTGSARVFVNTAPAAPLTVSLTTQAGAAGVPASVTIPAGATNAEFAITGIRQGVEELLAIPDDQRYSTAAARVNVAAPAGVAISKVSGGPDPVIVRVTDVNGLPYPGLRVQATPSTGGTVNPPVAVTDETGAATFRWTPGAAASNQLQIGLEGGGPGLTISAGNSIARAAAVVNAASFAGNLASGSLATVFGSGMAAGATASAGQSWPVTLAGVQVLLNGTAVPLFYVSDTQINFLVPSTQPQGPVELVVASAAGRTAPLSLRVESVAPGIFYDTASGYGAILNAGTAETTLQRPARRGGYLEIYSTGLGPVALGTSGLMETTFTPQASLAGMPAQVVYSGMSGYPGVYQVNVQVPTGVPSGAQMLSITLNGSRSNEVRVGIE